MLDTILIMCNVFINQIDKQIIEETTWGGYRAKLTKKKNSQYTWADLMNYGARIIYLIRTLLTEEDISFLFGITSGTETKTAFVTQQQLLTSMKKVSKNAIGVQLNSLETSLKTTKDLMDAQFLSARKNQWSKIQKLASINKGEPYQKTEKEIRGHQIYQKIRMDNQVYVRFSGKQTDSGFRSLYYDVQGNNNPDTFQFFNFGWLWEWYNSILMGDDDILYQTVEQEVNQGSIKNIILSTDSIAGTKMGDFQDLYGRQIQAKFNNQKIITYNNIKVILIQLTNALNIYKISMNSIEAKENLIKVLQEHFFPEGALIGNNMANNKINELLEKLNNSIVVKI